MITLLSFVEWQESQDADKIFEWGSTGLYSTESALNSVKFSEVPDDVRRMFYSMYVHEITKPDEGRKIAYSEPKDIQP